MSVLLLLAQSLLFPVGFRAFWRPRATPATKRCYLQCFVAFAFPGWLAGCSFWAALSGASGARARPHVSLLGWGPAGARHHLGQHAQPNQPYQSSGYISLTKDLT